MSGLTTACWLAVVALLDFDFWALVVRTVTDALS